MVGAALKALREMQYFLTGTDELARSRCFAQHASDLSIMLGTGHSRRPHHWRQNTMARRIDALFGFVGRRGLGVAMDFPNRRWDLANPRRDVRALCRGRDGKRALSEHSANANTPSGPASGRDANPSRMRGQPARWAVPC